MFVTDMVWVMHRISAVIQNTEHGIALAEGTHKEPVTGSCVKILQTPTPLTSESTTDNTADENVCSKKATGAYGGLTKLYGGLTKQLLIECSNVTWMLCPDSMHHSSAAVAHMEAV